MSFFFHEFLYRPLLNALVFLYNTVAFHDLGIAIVLLTLLVRVVLFPLFYKSFKNQALLQRLQPEIKRIQHDHKHDREKQAKALLGLYQTHKVNPFSSFLLLFIQLPVLIALYQVFSKGISAVNGADLYSFLEAPEAFQPTLLGLINLTKRSILIVGFAAAAQYVQGKLSLPKRAASEGNMERMSRQMVVMGPAFTILFLFSLPAAIGLYWLITSLFSLVQQVYINRSLSARDHPKNNGTATNTNRTTL